MKSISSLLIIPGLFAARFLWKGTWQDVGAMAVLAALWCVYGHFLSEAEKRKAEQVQKDTKEQGEIQKLAERIGKLEMKYAFNKPKESSGR